VDTVVQPDPMVVCDPGKLHEHGIWGAFDLIVEPVGRWVQQYVLGPEGVFAPEVTWERAGRLVSPTLPGFELDVGTIWEKG